MTRIAAVLPASLALVVALAAASCATAPETAAPEGGRMRVEGTITSIDTQPWAYDGNAIVELDVAGRGAVRVELPARWNLCKAEPVDVQALAVGMRVQAVGESTGEGGVVVCQDAADRLAPLQ
ncbi:hypothetical protein [Marilutibacter aestuarii]|uniref:hypothetical protein n=1 Tax=Marilutibacter aestuarii TaxID=1706195 RepID=UPI001FEA70F7|nr:hypothetical protein [Lysobacter aestuarii]